MARVKTLGVLVQDERTLSTSMTLKELREFIIPGLAFEQDALKERPYNHLTDRVKELAPVRSAIQRSFYNEGVSQKAARDANNKVVKDADGNNVYEDATKWVPTAKLKNAKDGCRRWVQTHYLHSWNKGPALMPEFIVYMPERIDVKMVDGFNAQMASEFGVADMTHAPKMMLLDGETRGHSVELALTVDGTVGGIPPLNGAEREKLLDKVVRVLIVHDTPEQEAAQVFADLNGEGTVLNKVQTMSRDTRDPWVRASWQIAKNLGWNLETEARQIGAVHRKQNTHLILSQMVTMVRAVGLGYSSAMGTRSYNERIDDVPGAEEKLVKAATKWFAEVEQHFGQGPSIFSDTSRVLKSMPVKVVVFGHLGNAFFSTPADLQGQISARALLKEINWNVDPRWQGIAGDIREKDGVYSLANASAKQLGSKVANALSKPTTKNGIAIREMSAAASNATQSDG